MFIARGGVCLGGLFGTGERWSETGAPAPDGTYALVRYDAGAVELLTDVTASRTIWWTQTDEALLASTSQRALVALLGDLRLDPAATAWLLSSGTLGPETAWDARLHVLPPDARLVLDRAAWRCRVDRRPAVFAAAARDAEAHVAALREAIAATCAELGLDLSQWLLPLSGGVDSRSILAAMAGAGATPQCVTWTTPASLRDPLSDARIAPLVARHFGAEHHHRVLAEPEGGPDWALDRFVSAGEGCNDEFSGYTDGCAVWRDLAGEGVSGRHPRRRVGRRAQARRARRRLTARRAAPSWSRTSTRPTRSGASASPPRSGRSGSIARTASRPRSTAIGMSQQVYVPMVLGPLNALKGRYLEIVNPLLSRRVIGAARELPDELRAYGRALHRVAGAACPWIPYSRNSSLPDAGHYLSRPDVIEALVRELTSPRMARVLSDEGAIRILVAMAAPDRTPATLRAQDLRGPEGGQHRPAGASLRPARAPLRPARRAHGREAGAARDPREQDDRAAGAGRRSAARAGAGRLIAPAGGTASSSAPQMHPAHAGELHRRRGRVPQRENGIGPHAPQRREPVPEADLTSAHFPQGVRHIVNAVHPAHTVRWGGAVTGRPMASRYAR